MMGSRPLVPVLIVLAASTCFMAACGQMVATTPQQDRAQAAWADLQSEYSGRALLTTPLAQAVQRANPQDLAVLTRVQTAQAAAQAVRIPIADPLDVAKVRQGQAAQARLDKALSYVRWDLRTDPALGPNETVRKLALELEGREASIRIAQRDYDEAASDYNQSRNGFVSGLWAIVRKGSDQTMPRLPPGPPVVPAPAPLPPPSPPPPPDPVPGANTRGTGASPAVPAGSTPTVPVSPAPMTPPA